MFAIDGDDVAVTVAVTNSGAVETTAVKTEEEDDDDDGSVSMPEKWTLTDDGGGGGGGVNCKLSSFGCSSAKASPVD